MNEKLDIGSVIKEESRKLMDHRAKNLERMKADYRKAIEKLGKEITVLVRKIQQYKNLSERESWWPWKGTGGVMSDLQSQLSSKSRIRWEKEKALSRLESEEESILKMFI